MNERRAGFLTKFRRFNWEERRALAEAIVLVILAAPVVRFVSLPKVGRIASFAPRSVQLTTERREYLVEMVAWAVDRSAKRSPARSLCFEQGLAAQIMLRRRGVDSTLLYGVGTGDAPDKRIDAHVWVRDGHRPVVGEPAPGRFAVLMTCPKGREALGTQGSA